MCGPCLALLWMDLCEAVVLGSDLDTGLELLRPKS
jgi:hypothetical protein